jgi:hypothetical protein
MSAYPELNADTIAKADAMGVSVAHVSMQWEDVTAQFTAASDSLKIGEIISGPNFSLQESMSAIELMDPKMDIGLGSARVLTLAEIEASGRLPKAETLSPAQWLSIMDSLIIAELMHYEGFHLAQGILTCYYMQAVPRLLGNNPILHSFATGLLRRSYHIRECFTLAKNYSEEDWIQYNFGFDIGDSLEDATVTAQLSELIASETQRIEQMPAGNEKEISEAILVRLKWNRSMYLAQRDFSEPNKAGLANATTHLNESLSYFPAILESAKHAINPETSESRTAGGADAIRVDPKAPISTGTKIFEYEIMRRWTNATPPNTQPWNSLETALSHWKTIIGHLMELVPLPETLVSIRDAKETLIDLVVNKKAGLLARSRFLTIVWHDRKFLGKITLEEALLQDCTQQFGISMKYAKADEKTLEFHLGLCETGIADHFNALAITRARARRRLPHIFQHWSTLLYDGDVLDSKIFQILKIVKDEEKGRGFARWHLDMIQQMIADYLTIGFELDLYEPCEIPMIWWYLDNVTSARQKSHWKVLEAAEIYAANALQSAKKRASGNRGKSSAPSATASSVEVKPNWYAHELEAKFHLTRGIFLLIAACDAAGLFAPSKQNISSPHTRYFSRFHCLLNLNQPPAMRFPQFQASYLEIIKDRLPSDLLSRASKSIQSALKSFQDFSNTAKGEIKPPSIVLKEAQKLLTLSLKNGFTIAALTKSNILDTMKLQPPTKPTHYVAFDFSNHHVFPIVAVKEKQSTSTQTLPAKA